MYILFQVRNVTRQAFVTEAFGAPCSYNFKASAVCTMSLHTGFRFSRALMCLVRKKAMKMYEIPSEPPVLSCATAVTEEENITLSHLLHREHSSSQSADDQKDVTEASAPIDDHTF